MQRSECELSIEKSGAVLGRVTLEYETFRDSAGWGDTEGEMIHSLSNEQIGEFMTWLTPLLVRRADGRTAEVTITNVIDETRVSVLFGHAPFSNSVAKE